MLLNMSDMFTKNLCGICNIESDMLKIQVVLNSFAIF